MKFRTNLRQDLNLGAGMPVAEHLSDHHGLRLSLLIHDFNETGGDSGVLLMAPPITGVPR